MAPDTYRRLTEAPTGITFLDRYDVPVPAGSYTLTVTDTVDPSPGADCVPSSAAQASTTSQAFTVAGPRFTLPPEAVYALTPPAGGRGAFGGFVPTVVFTDHLLPWIRQDQGLPEGTPWVALLLLRPCEFRAVTAANYADPWGTPQPDQGAATCTLKQLLSPKDPATTHLPTYETPPTSDELAQQVLGIDLRYDLFQALAPTVAELPTLAHVRKITTSLAKDDQALTAAGTTADGAEFSAMLGNRFVARAGGDYTACLVSLEGLGNTLQAGPWKAPATDPTHIRLVVLATWRFSSVSGGTFEDLTDLLRGAGTDYLRMAPADAPATPPKASDMVAIGYALLSYQTRGGQTGQAWYRGPGSPVPTARYVEEPPVVASAELITTDPATGLPDLTYAAAFEIGRLVALAHPGVATQIFEFLRQTGVAIGTLADRRALVERVGAEGFPEDARRLLAGHLGHELLSARWHGSLGAAARHGAFGPPRPPRAGPARPRDPFAEPAGPLRVDLTTPPEQTP